MEMHMYLSDSMYLTLKAEQFVCLRNELQRHPHVYEVVGKLRKKWAAEDEATSTSPECQTYSPTMPRSSVSSASSSAPVVPTSASSTYASHQHVSAVPISATRIPNPTMERMQYPPGQGDYATQIPPLSYLPLSANVVTKSVTGGTQLGKRYDVSVPYLPQSSPLPPRTAYSLFSHSQHQPEPEVPRQDPRPALITRPQPPASTSAATTTTSTTSSTGSSFVMHRQSIDPETAILNQQPLPVLKEHEVQVDIQALERPGGNRAWKETCTTPSVIGKMRKYTLRVCLPAWIGKEWRASFQGYDHARSLTDPSSGDTATKTNIFKFHGGRMTSIVFQVEVENTSEKLNNNGLFLCQYERKKEDSYHSQLTLAMDFSERDFSFTHFFLIPKWGRTRTRDHQFQVRMCLIINEEYVYHLLTFPISIAAHQHESKYPSNPTSYSTIVNLQKATI